MALALALFIATAPLRADAQSSEADVQANDEGAELGPVPPPPAIPPHRIHHLALEGATSERGARPVGLFVAGAATVAAMFGVEFVGLLISVAACDGFFGSASCLGAGFAASTVFAGAAALALVPLVVWAAGQSLGGHGSYGWTFLGHALGALAWCIVPAVVAVESEDSIVPAVLFAGLAQAGGATLAYELSTE
jgi:hypothetical protein